MQPFRFGPDKAKNKPEIERLKTAALLAKPSGLNDEYRRRLDFYLHRQRPFIEAEVRKKFPKTYPDVAPYLQTTRILRMITDERAKVFLNGAALELVDGDAKPLPTGSGEAKRWADVAEEMDLGLTLKLADRYTHLDRTTFIRIDRSEGGPMAAQVYLAENVEVVPDPARPFDLDAAHAVLLRIGGDAEASVVVDPRGQRTSRGDRYEFWCGRPGAEAFAIVWDDGTVETSVEGKEFPYRDVAGKAVVPVILFSLHKAERGLFTNEERGLSDRNAAIDVLVTETHHMMSAQGFGQLVISYPPGQEPPPHQALVVGPTRALELTNGATGSVLSPSPQVMAAIELIDRDVKHCAMEHGIPPGSVSLEARAVASGVALQIEMRPLMEQRTDAIDYYRPSMRRIWRVAQVVHDTRIGTSEPALVGLKARWNPGDVQLPESEDALVERLVLLASKGWVSDAEAVAKIRKIGIEEAEQVLAKMRTDRAARRPTEEEAMGVEPRRPSVAVPGGPDDEEPDAPVTPPSEPPVPDPAAAPAGSKAAQVEAQAVDPASALNGAQVQALVEVVQAVARGELPRASGVEIIVASFPVTREAAEQIMGEVGKTFTPTAVDPQAPAIPPPPAE
jgi:hypothetical protein